MNIHKIIIKIPILENVKNKLQKNEDEASFLGIKSLQIEI